ncbi:MAG: hypothetical protein AABZ44_05775 [Elusimicrobiota bacterium]
MDRILKSLSVLAKPWDGPYWLLLTLIAINRSVVARMADPPNEGDGNLIRSLPGIGKEALTALAMCAVFAGCIMIMLVVLKNRIKVKAAFGDLFKMCLKAQSSYLLAAPLALLTLAAGAYLDDSGAQVIGQSLKGLLPLGMFVLLFMGLRRRFGKMDEVSVIGLLFSPYIVMTAVTLMALFAMFLFMAMALVILLNR